MSFMVLTKVDEEIEISCDIRMDWYERRFVVQGISVNSVDPEVEINGSILRTVTPEKLLRTSLQTVSRESVWELQDSIRLVSQSPKLGRVAIVYAVAWVLREEPVKAVCEELGIPISTATLHVRKAKQSAAVDYALSFLTRHFNEELHSAVFHV